MCSTDYFVLRPRNDGSVLSLRTKCGNLFIRSCMCSTDYFVLRPRNDGSVLSLRTKCGNLFIRSCMCSTDYFVLRPRNDGSVLLRLGSISNSRSLHHCLALLRQCAVCYMVLSTARVYHFLCQVNINFTCVRISPYFCFYAAFMALHSFLCKRARP